MGHKGLSIADSLSAVVTTVASGDGETEGTRMSSTIEPPLEASLNKEEIHPPQAFDPAAPAFLVGVTGYMSLGDEHAERVATRLRLVFRILRQGGKAANPEQPGETLSRSLANLMVRPTEPATPTQTEARQAYEQMLAGWPGLGDVPIAVMTNLAPGVDTIATRIALEAEFRAAGFHVRAPLPFPPDIYRDASTFIRTPEAPTTEDRQRQHDFDQLLDRIGCANAFPIYLQSDMPSASDERAELLRRERDDRANSALRYRRYYAAGEFLAVASHLLIAVWDGEPGELPGTASVVEARLRGPRGDVLTTTEGIRQPAGGPTLHLFARREDEDAANDETSPAARLLHPFSSVGEDEPGDRLLGEGQGGWSEPTGDAARQTRIANRNQHALTAQQDRFATLCRIAANLREFDRCPPHPTPADQENDYRSLLKHGKQDFYPQIRAMRMEGEAAASADDEGEFSRSQRNLSSLRFKATKASRALKEKHDRSLRILFWITLLAATLLHLFSHWHVEEKDHDSEQVASAGLSDHPPAKGAGPPPGGGHDEHFSPFQFGAGCLAALFAAAALLYFFRCRMRRYAERHHDYRAIAEGVRVQFYWNLAGLGHSVSANYMHRQRSELDWIRAAIRSVAIPYEAWRERFRRLSRQDQVTALRCVLHCWIDVQRDYFEKSWHAHHRTLHAWHKLGAVLAIGGVIVLGLCVAAKWYPAAFEHDRPYGLLLLVAAAVIWLVVMAVRYATSDLRHAGEHPGHDRLWVRWIHRFVPAPEDHATSYRTPGERAFRSILGFFARLPLALAFVFVACQISCWSHHEDLPKAEVQALVFGGVALLAGALAVAWAEKNLLSELAYQYNTMHSLFRDASSRLEFDLRELEGLTNGPSGAFDARLDEIQEYLYALGKEALDENAEWLLLHRARPLEPVMAG
jgi:hypothetical protein